MSWLAGRWFVAGGIPVALTLAVALCASADQPQKARPNIVFIMADDLGYTDLACYGSQYYETPHIDSLASQGMRLTCHHQCQNCAPSRAAIMTGQYGPRTGVYTVGSIDRFDWSQRPLRPVDNVVDLPLDRSIIAKQLKAAGYATGMFGKWHLGNSAQYHPGARGFDEAIESAGKHFGFKTDPATSYPRGQYLADFLTDRAVDFIRRHQDGPFFLYLPHFGVHGTHEAKPDLIERFARKRPAGGHRDPTYAAMIASIDESVGRIQQTLDELGLAENTVVIFTSDNGGVGGYLAEGVMRTNAITDNAPLRNGKGSLYEGGTRVPLIVRWPGIVAAGSECHQPTIHVDFYPTLIEIAGASAPEHVLDGESMVAILKNPQQSLERDAIFQHFPGYLGAPRGMWRTTPVTTVQKGDWKLMEFLEDGRLELYNLRDDHSESRNLAPARPEKTQELHALMIAWREAVKAPMPTKNDGSKKAAQKRKSKVK